MSVATVDNQAHVASATINDLGSSAEEKQAFLVTPSTSTASSHSATCATTSAESSVADQDNNNNIYCRDREDADMMADIEACRRALDLFLDSKIAEAELILRPHLCQASMYYALGKSTMLCLKSMMTFQHSDMEEAIDMLKHTNHLANQVRKAGSKSAGTGWLSWVRDGGRLTVDHLKKMKRVYLHAELVHAEAYMLKALLCVVHDESLISLLREGIHVRSAYQTFSLLEKYVESVREEEAQGKDVSAYKLDKHFVSGVNFGMGTFQVMLSLLPGFVLKVLEVIGMSGSREHGMCLIESTGGWDKYKETGIAPARQGPDEALRRQFCDILLIGYHVLLAKLVPVSDADDDLGDRVLAYNLALYPKGVFFLYFRGRQLFSLTKLREAKEKYIEAIETQKDWAQLQHMCFWEQGLIATLEHDWATAADMFDTLFQESNWSKAVYTYFRAVALYMMAQEADSKKKERLMTQVIFMMKRVPNFLQKIAGKSIPLEKFVSRKSRKFVQQGNRLFLPDLEIAQAFSACDYIPLNILKINLDRIERELAALDRSNETYYDDLCLAHYLRAMMARLILIKVDTEKDKLRSIHCESMETVFTNAQNVVYDHYLYYHARYENARMLMLDDRLDDAAREIQVITVAHEKGKYNVGAGHRAKSKYSLESVLLFKCHNCRAEIETLKKEQKNDSRSSISSKSSDYRSL